MVLVQYKPTRSVLLQLRRTRRVAERGHKLLKLKQDALIVEFFRVLERAKAVRSNLVEKYKVAEARESERPVDRPGVPGDPEPKGNRAVHRQAAEENGPGQFHASERVQIARIALLPAGGDDRPRRARLLKWLWRFRPDSPYSGS